MFETQTAQIRLDELNRCRDRAWLSIEDQRRYGTSNLTVVEKNGVVAEESEPSGKKNQKIFRIGQEVFFPGNHFMGLITKLYFTSDGRVSHLAVRMARLLGHHKIVPVEYVSEVNPKGVSLAIDKDRFRELSNYRTDAILAEDFDRALWADRVLRDTDYHEIDVHVNNGIIALSGHVISSMNQWRAEKAVEEIQGVLGVRNHLIPDDKLVFEVAEALAPLEQEDGCKLFTKVENGVVTLVGKVSSMSIGHRAEQCVANIPWVRGVVNEIRVTGAVLEDGDQQRFLQPSIGKEIFFHGGPSVTVRQVVINPHNRRVVGMVVFGQFSDLQPGVNQWSEGEEAIPERLVVIPVSEILHLTHSSGFLRIKSSDTNQYKDFEPSQYRAPNLEWLPPYPYCSSEVLFLLEEPGS